MIDELKNDAIINKFGGRFKLTALLQRRWLELMQGARPMVPFEGLTPLEVAVKEIAEGKLDMTLEPQEREDSE